MDKNQKRITVMIGAFLLIFVISIVYALATGLFTFQGSVGFNANMKLVIFDEDIIAPEDGDTVSLSDNDQTLTFSLNFGVPGESRVIEFYVKNTGNISATLGTMQEDLSNPAAGSGAVIYWPALDGITIAPGNSDGPFFITVSWDEDVPSATGTLNYKATISYDQTPAGS